MIKIEIKKLVESGVTGLIMGAGIDSLLWATTSYVPQLAEPSPIKIPGWHPPETNTHWDDIIGIAVAGVLTAFGAVKKNIPMVVEGISMIAGEWFVSQFQPLPIKPWAAAKISTSKYQDLVQVD